MRPAAPSSPTADPPSSLRVARSATSSTLVFEPPKYPGLDLASICTAAGENPSARAWRGREAGGREGPIEDPHDGCAHDSREPLAAAGGIGSGHTPGLIGRGAQRNPRRTAGDQVAHFGAIAGRVDAAKAGFHVVVGTDSTGASNFDAGLGGQFHIGPKSGGEDHDIGRKVEWPERPLRSVVLRRIRLSWWRTSPVHHASSRRRSCCERSSTVTRSPLRRSASAASSPIYPGSYHRGMARMLVADERAQAGRVVERVEREDVFRQRCDCAGIVARAGGDHEVLVAHPLAGFERDFAPRMADGHHARARPHIDVALLAEVLRRVDNEVGSLADTALHEVGQPAGAKRNHRAFFQDDDFQVRVEMRRARAAALRPAATPPITTSATAKLFFFLHLLDKAKNIELIELAVGEEAVDGVRFRR
jgi:hypothetical protein